MCAVSNIKKCVNLKFTGLCLNSMPDCICGKFEVGSKTLKNVMKYFEKKLLRKHSSAENSVAELEV